MYNYIYEKEVIEKEIKDERNRPKNHIGICTMQMQKK